MMSRVVLAKQENFNEGNGSIGERGLSGQGVDVPGVSVD